MTTAASDVGTCGEVGDDRGIAEDAVVEAALGLDCFVAGLVGNDGSALREVHVEML